MIPTYMVVRATGLIDSLWALILPVAINPFNLIVMRQFFLNIPEELHEAAKQLCRVEKPRDEFRGSGPRLKEYTFEQRLDLGACIEGVEIEKVTDGGCCKDEAGDEIKRDTQHAQRDVCGIA